MNEATQQRDIALRLITRICHSFETVYGQYSAAADSQLQRSVSIVKQTVF